jgi:hypothetical protein
MSIEDDWRKFGIKVPFNIDLSTTLYKYGRWMVDVENQEINADDVSATIFGLDYETPLIKPLEIFYQFVIPEDRELVEQSVSNTVNFGDEYLAIYTIRKINGELRRLLSVGQLRISASNKKYIWGIVVDITEKDRTIAKKSLADSLKRAQPDSPPGVFRKLVRSMMFKILG